MCDPNRLAHLTSPEFLDVIALQATHSQENALVDLVISFQGTLTPAQNCAFRRIDDAYVALAATLQTATAQAVAKAALG